MIDPHFDLEDKCDKADRLVQWYKKSAQIEEMTTTYILSVS